MLRDAAITEIRRDLGFNNSLDVQILIDGLKNAQASLEREPELPYFLRTEYASIPTVAGEERVAIPTASEFLMIVEDSALWRFDAAEDLKWKELTKHDLDALRRKYSATDNAEPVAYALDNLYFRVFPIPDKVYTLKMIYYAKAAVLDTNIENSWLEHFPQLLISMAVQRVSKSTRDAAAFQLAKSVEADERIRLRTFIVARETSNYTYQMGGPD